MKVVNLSIFSLIPVIALAYTDCYSRFALTLVHWDNKDVNGSYVTLRNNPLLPSTYNFTIVAGKGADAQSLNYTVTGIRHDPTGLVDVMIRWPDETIADHLTLSVHEEGVAANCSRNASVSMQTTPPPRSSQSVYYPRDAHTGSVSMRYINKTWVPVWDNDAGEIWLLNQDNPQQVQLVEITPTQIKAYCFVCSKGISTDLGNYTVYLLSAAGESKTISLNNQTIDSGGYIISPYDEFTAVSYNLTFTIQQGGNLNTSLVAQGQVTQIQAKPSASYTSVYRDGPVFENVHMNEIHFPKAEINLSDSNSYWIEFIGPANTNLSSYCIALTSDSKNTTCTSLGLAAITSGKGYYIWTPDMQTLNMILSRTYENIDQRPAEVYSIRLHRETEVSVKFLERVTFTWLTSDRAGLGCVGLEMSLFLQSAPGDVLCLDPEHFLRAKSSYGISRCGIQKDPGLIEHNASMTVWYVKAVTKKDWNHCNRPLGYLSRIALIDNKITISSLADESDSGDVSLDPVIGSRMHLPNMGLMFGFWHASNSNLQPVQLRGVDLTINESSSSFYYPMPEMNITLRKKDEPYVNGANLYASGGALASFVRPYVYVVALVHHYSFLPPFDIHKQYEQVVDAVVYSPKQTPLDVKTISLVMRNSIGDVLEQGQIVLDKSDSPVMVNTQRLQSQVDSWEGLSADDETYELDKLYIIDKVHEYLRIKRSGNNQNQNVELQLLALPPEYRDMFDGGVSLERVCLSVSVYSSYNNQHQSAAFARFTEDDTIKIGGTLRATLIPRVPGSVVYSLTAPSYLQLFKKPSSATSCEQVAMDLKLDGATGYDSLGLTIDAVGLTHQAPASAFQHTINDSTEVVRCNSKRPAFGPAFSVVNITKECPVPHDLFIYKICQQRIGIMSDKTDFYPLATDFLYLVQVDSTNTVLNITALRRTYPYLGWKHNMINAPDFIIFSTQKITSYALTWFPDGAPKIGSRLTNHTLSVAVVYPSDNLKTAAKMQLTNILQTAELPRNARRMPVLYTPSPGDRRHCVIGCNRQQPVMSEIIDFETLNFTFEDKTCLSDYSQQYRDVRINEINADTLGFKDKGEFIELIGTPNFEYASGLSVAILTVDKYEPDKVIYKSIVHVSDTKDKVFDSNGYFIFEYTNNNETANNFTWLQTFPYYRSLPNDCGAVALLWGAKLVDGVAQREVVLQNHTKLPNFFLDLVVYAKNQTVAQGRDVRFLLNWLSNEKRSLQGNVAIELHGAVNSAETISRCFCKDSWDMSCFEMSYNETKRAANICPTRYTMEATWCVTDKNITGNAIANHIAQFMAGTVLCRNLTCFFSKYQVRGFKSCELDTKSQLQQWNFTIGFPSEDRLEQLGPLITVENLKSFGAVYLRSCPDAPCQVSSPNGKSAKTTSGTVIIGAVVGAVILLVLTVVITIVVLKKRRTRRRHLSARFEAHCDDEDDDTFLPEGGTISFSNPRYSNQHNGSDGNENGSKKQYQRLSQDKI